LRPFSVVRTLTIPLTHSGNDSRQLVTPPRLRLRQSLLLRRIIFSRTSLVVVGTRLLPHRPAIPNSRIRLKGQRFAVMSRPKNRPRQRQSVVRQPQLPQIAGWRQLLPSPPPTTRTFARKPTRLLPQPASRARCRRVQPLPTSTGARI
jgi:hypothetical protein